MDMASAFTLDIRPDNVAVITIDSPGEKMNTLKPNLASRCGRSFARFVIIKPSAAWC